MKTKKDIRNLSKEDLALFLKKNGHAKFRLQQIEDWIWKKRVTSFSAMKNLSQEIRNSLDQIFDFRPIRMHKCIESKDGTIKYSMRLYDNQFIESVIIPSRKRLTACISSQVGCSLECKFCATGLLSLQRNLHYAEIYDQAYILNQKCIEKYGKSLTNIVFMGMGEPLLNYNNLITSISLITTKKGMGFSPKRITVSTAGIAKMIYRLAKDKVAFNLAISLHAAIDKERTFLMPINASIPINELQESILDFYKKTNTRPTYEYILFDGINDSLDHAKALIKFCSVSPCKINLIEYNTVKGLNFTKSSKEKTEAFIRYLEKKRLIVNLRKSRGKDIDAACGQLINLLQ